MIDKFDNIFSPEARVFWQDFSQLIVCGEGNRVLSVLNDYMAEVDLVLADATQDPLLWEQSLFLYERRWDVDGEERCATILTEPDRPLSDCQITEDFAYAFMRCGELDGVFILNNNHLNLLQIVTFRGGVARMIWVDSPSSYQYVGESLQMVPSAKDLPMSDEDWLVDTPAVFVEHLFEPMGPSFVRFYDDSTGEYKEESAIDFLKKFMALSDLDPFDELARYAFIEKVILDFGLVFSPSMESFDFFKILHPSE